MALLRIEKPQWVGLSLAFAQKVGNGHAVRSEICNRQSSGTQQRCAISSAIALADCTWLLDIGDRRMRTGDVQKPASDFLCKPLIPGNTDSHTGPVADTENDFRF